MVDHTFHISLDSKGGFRWWILRWRGGRSSVVTSDRICTRNSELRKPLRRQWPSAIAFSGSRFAVHCALGFVSWDKSLNGEWGSVKKKKNTGVRFDFAQAHLNSMSPPRKINGRPQCSGTTSSEPVSCSGVVTPCMSSDSSNQPQVL